MVAKDFEGMDISNQQIEIRDFTQGFWTYSR